MRYICKAEAPERFRRWKARNKKARKKVANWDEFPETERRYLRGSLIDEQLSMCCYCERMISPEDSHIEHLMPKGNPSYQKYMFLYENLLASCNETDSCGIRKSRWYEPEMVSPLDENCAARFTYTSDGRMIPFDETDSWAEKTIEKLGLNCRRLIDRRRSIIMGLDNNGEGPDPIYLKAVLGEIYEKRKRWPYGFLSVLLYLAEIYDISV